jgi:hypothetical protein
MYSCRLQYADGNTNVWSWRDATPEFRFDVGCMLRQELGTYTELWGLDLTIGFSIISGGVMCKAPIVSSLFLFLPLHVCVCFFTLRCFCDPAFVPFLRRYQAFYRVQCFPE